MNTPKTDLDIRLEKKPSVELSVRDLKVCELFC